MEAISRRKNMFAAFAGLGAIFSALSFAWGIWKPSILLWALLPLSILASGFMVIFWLRTCRKLQIAQLITENNILQICLAVSADKVRSEKLEAYISYFGILLGSEIIKFNQDGIFLKAIEIGKDFISISYSADEWVKNTRLLRPTVSSEEVEILAKRFQEETGIVPAIIG